MPWTGHQKGGGGWTREKENDWETDAERILLSLLANVTYTIALYVASLQNVYLCRQGPNDVGCITATKGRLCFNSSNLCELKFCHRFRWCGVFDTGGKFATGVNNTGGKLPPISTTPVQVANKHTADAFKLT